MTLAQWFSFNGRISRKTWWIFYFLIPIGINIAAGALDTQFTGPKNALPDKSGMGDYGMGAFSIAAGLVGIWIGLAGLAKRWHDRDKSGWWVLLNFIPVIGPLICFIVAGFLRPAVTAGNGSNPIPSRRLGDGNHKARRRRPPAVGAHRSLHNRAAAACRLFAGVDQDGAFPWRAFRVKPAPCPIPPRRSIAFLKRKPRRNRASVAFPPCFGAFCC
jgi:uncharacterized membrane protein YhaH (DUF805 family)